MRVTTITLAAVLSAAALAPAAASAQGDVFAEGYVYHGGVVAERIGDDPPGPRLSPVAEDIYSSLRASFGPAPDSGYVMRQAPEAGSASVLSGRAVAEGPNAISIDGEIIVLGGTVSLEEAACVDGSGEGYDCVAWGTRALASVVDGADTSCFVPESGGDRQVRCETLSVDLSRWAVAAGVTPAEAEDPEMRVLEEGARNERRGIWSGSFISRDRSWQPPS